MRGIGRADCLQSAYGSFFAQKNAPKLWRHFWSVEQARCTTLGAENARKRLFYKGNPRNDKALNNQGFVV
jgi:hypothetical protein